MDIIYILLIIQCSGAKYTECSPDLRYFQTRNECLSAQGAYQAWRRNGICIAVPDDRKEPAHD